MRKIRISDIPDTWTIGPQLSPVLAKKSHAFPKPGHDNRYRVVHDEIYEYACPVTTNTFYLFLVIDRAAEALRTIHLTGATSYLRQDLHDNSLWGSCLGYDIMVNQTKRDQSFLPLPAKPLTPVELAGLALYKEPFLHSGEPVNVSIREMDIAERICTLETKEEARRMLVRLAPVINGETAPRLWLCVINIVYQMDIWDDFYRIMKNVAAIQSLI